MAVRIAVSFVNSPLAVGARASLGGSGVGSGVGVYRGRGVPTLRGATRAFARASAVALFRGRATGDPVIATGTMASTVGIATSVAVGGVLVGRAVGMTDGLDGGRAGAQATAVPIMARASIANPFGTRSRPRDTSERMLTVIDRPPNAVILPS
jgi:hypothetical protein